MFMFMTIKQCYITWEYLSTMTNIKTVQMHTNQKNFAITTKNVQKQKHLNNYQQHFMGLLRLVFLTKTLRSWNNIKQSAANSIFSSDFLLDGCKFRECRFS